MTRVGEDGGAGRGSARGAAVVIGAGGGIGRALAEALVARGGGAVTALSRTACEVAGATSGRVDVTDEATLAAAACAMTEPPTLVLVATGVLQGVAARPERRLAELEAEGLAESFRVNAVGPALAAKHFAPRLARDRRAVFAVLSARVGSIADNRAGGWYGYRASKAALNMIVRSLAVELARTHPQAIALSLHPGTVDTALSRPFQRGLPVAQLQAPEQAAARLLAVLDAATPAESGGFVAYDGSHIPF